MRGSGTTSKQMKEAPIDALYIWCNHDLFYPRELATRLGRLDLRIERPSFLSGDAWRRLYFTDIVVDHATALNDEQRTAFNSIRSRSCT